MPAGKVSKNLVPDGATGDSTPLCPMQFSTSLTLTLKPFRASNLHVGVFSWNQDLFYPVSLNVDGETVVRLSRHLTLP